MFYVKAIKSSNLRDWEKDSRTDCGESYKIKKKTAIFNNI